tara:strand:- start:19088 stop:19687 length:600 start_codon:yes stop_codon:yes gene_type:complete
MASRAGTFISIDEPVLIEDVFKFLRDLSKTYPDFNKEARKAGQSVAELLVVAATFEAASVTRNKQALEVMKGVKAQYDRIPTIKLNEKSAFQSKSRKFSSSYSIKSHRRVKRKVTRGDVFFGAEFGGGSHGSSNLTTAGAKSRAGTEMFRKGGGRTTQFLRHRGKSGYFFWPAVRKNKDNIAKEYLNAIDRVLEKLKDR